MKGRGREGNELAGGEMERRELTIRSVLILIRSPTVPGTPT